VDTVPAVYLPGGLPQFTYIHNTVRLFFYSLTWCCYCNLLEKTSTKQDIFAT